jgi:cyclic beta-1,2-glucan glucanotransferase
LKNNSIQELLSHLRISFPGDNLMKKYSNEKPPLRSELFSADQMESYGKTLAHKHEVTTDRAPNKLLKRLADNEDVLVEVHDLMTEAVKANSRIIPAGEWLLDNFYLILEQIRTGKKHLPKGYSEDLPKLLNGPSAGLPRVYDLAIEIISHSDGRVDIKSLSNFIAAYQTVTKLKLGELWAIPIMLRLALIENLRRLAAQIAMDRIYQNLADYWAGQMTETAEKDPKSLILVIADMARSGPPMVSSFVAELTRRLQGKGPSLALPLNWIEQRLSETGQTSSELVYSEIQKQAADQVSMSNSISSLRFLGTTDWREFVETTSDVEKILREDISGIYTKMDFSTRDRYRHIIEKIAKRSSMSEHEIAKNVTGFAKDNAAKNDTDKRTTHVGYYLIGKGIRQTERAAKMRFSFAEYVRRIIYNSPFIFYAGSIIFLSMLFGAGLFAKAYGENYKPWILITAGILAVLCTSQLAVSLVNWLATLVISPRELPRMDFSKNIAEDCRTLVVVPTMLLNPSDIEMLAEALEVRFLANKESYLHFGLLTDFVDAKEETLPGDEGLIELAKQKIEDLNIKYKNIRDDIFFLFHRSRRWNNNDKIWMGYERKRGKLSELNALLRGNGEKYFSEIVGSREILQQIKYVLTLDTDTQLPRDAAWKIIATMAHPLNRPLYNEKKQRVTEGYGILQPRVAMSLPGSSNSLYATVHGNDQGIDPYTRATSDVYQDLFEEGSFIGKGIYDVDVFTKTLENRFPENRILSHDLLEGCYTRCGLLSDVQLYEEYPLRYNTDVKRRHRWIRGDWQIAAWLMPLVPGANKRLEKNHLSALSRWKIFDNLRRSLVPSALLLLLLYGWIIFHAAWFWTLSVIAMVLLPHLVATAGNVIRKPKDILLKQHFKDSIQAATNNFIETLFTIVCLPYEAYYTLDAIIKTNWRMFISHKHLLEWNPSHNTKINTQKSIAASFKQMWFAPFTGLGMIVYIIISAPINLLTGLPILILWIASPGIAWWLSLPLAKTKNILSEEQVIFLRKLARKTWAFFEIFVGKEDNWLPPDNYQEHPVARIAHRTSPTNIGLSLLANLSACDFGYIPNGQFIQRTANTLASMQKLERYRGHLYNWYDTKSLLPLPPRYISTVDSGNLAGHILTLYHGLLAVPAQKIIPPVFFEGLNDTYLLLKDQLNEGPLIESFQKILNGALENYPAGLLEVKICIEKLSASANEIFTGINAEPISDIYFWVNQLSKQCTDALQELNMLIPATLFDPVPKKFNGFANFDGVPSLRDLATLDTYLFSDMSQYRFADNNAEENKWLDKFETCMQQTMNFANERISAVETLASICIDFANIEYDFLYDKSQHLLTIGYNVEDHRKDSGSYDLLASEARLGIFTGIAQGKLPQESWFALGRQLTNHSGTPVLLSWSGSMFEYLMPLLVMPNYENTLLDQTYKAMVQMQISYGEQRDVAWGISESGYNMVDASLNYQYRAFGVPGLGFKRGLAEDLVIAPYASAMALMVVPQEACENLEKLSAEGFEGRYGFFEAIDYTASRLPRGQSDVLIRSFMVHHQGMSFLSLAYLLLDKPMQKRFESEPQFQATLLLLQERIPKAIAYYAPATDVADTSVPSAETEMRIINTPNTTIPEVQLLSNGKYHVMITNSGAGYSRWKDISVTRWREDTTCDNWGTFCYIKDLENGIFWSTGFQPTLKQTKDYEVVFSQGRAEFRRKDNNIETHTEIVVSPEDDIEMRRVHLTNRSRKQRIIEVTSYAEVVLASAASDNAHPAFSNLFVQTEIVSQRHAILCTRRPRSVEDQCPWMFHLMNVYGAKVEKISYETDRMQFTGRRNSTVQPQAMISSNALAGNEGSVLDPIVSIRYKIIIEPDATAIIDMVIGVAENKDTCQSLVEKYQDRHLADRAFELSWTHSQVVLRQINATEADAQLYGKLASSVIYANASLRGDPAVLIKNQRGQSGLWSYSISGDLPIVLLQIEDPANIELVKQLVQAHAYWRLKGLIVDLVIWNEDHGGYRQLLQNQLLGLISAGVDSDIADRPGGIFIRSADQISAEDRVLFQTVARIIISDTKGSLAYQVNKKNIAKTIVPNLTPKSSFSQLITNIILPQDLLFFNGLGGFTPDGKEYIIITGNQQSTPAPWVNVLANANFGTVISESGQSYTWANNAHEFRLSPWNNDPVSDSAGEAFYIRDEESGNFWSPAPLPVIGKTSYLTRHGFGYSVFEHVEDGIYSQMTVYVDLDAAVKFTVIKFHNKSGRQRHLSATGYTEWVLGDVKPKSAMHIVTQMDIETGALFAANPYNSEFGDKVCFFTVNDKARTFTSDRLEFIGRNGNLKKPDALFRLHLAGRTGAALDACAAMQVSFDIDNNEEHEIIFLLGAGNNIGDASEILNRFQTKDSIHKSLENIYNYWNKTLGNLHIETPEPSLNIITNGWLMYQTLACRFWARSGFYQSGGAFGFRDQLQDSMAIMHTEPKLVREHILRSASRQFREGDVQHWWHPPSGRGVRTRCSDDFLWLPFTTSRYVSYTGDTKILDETIHFLEARLLNPGEESYYDLPGHSNDSASLYEHCVRAIKHGLQFGINGLPLMGSGDWNDGMDKVGIEGKGESIWLGFFLYKVLIQFSDIAKLRSDTAFTQQCLDESEKLKNNINKNGWDGEWFRRAYFDDGTPLGSSANEECKIDSIAQSWSVLSGAVDEKRSTQALQMADNNLVKNDKSLIQLLTPAFDKSQLNPGYIKGYVPGVRENGGQYTHAAIWLVMAFAASGNYKRAWELFALINPLNHGRTKEEIAVYKVEPYVVAADVYALSSLNGRGGWTWYTGSAGWMYQLIIESLLGMRREGNILQFETRMPAEWKSFTLRYKFEDTYYQIVFLPVSENKEMSVIIDSVVQQERFITLNNDQQTHNVEVAISRV